MSLSSLPEELLIQIIEQIKDTKILARLCLCSRRFSLVARPQLYSSFRQTGSTALPLFIRTILTEENGHLALLVKRYVGSTRKTSRLNMSVLTEENRSRIDRILGLICDYQRPESLWRVWLHGGQNWDAVTALAMSILPNLESIDMVAYGSENCYPFIQNVLFRAATLQSEMKPSVFSMSKLHSVSLQHHDMRSGLGMHYIMPFLSLKSVKIFKGHMIADINYQWDPFSTFETTDISINYSNIDAISLQRFLRHFNSLRRFEYEHAGAIVGSSDLIPAAIGRGLSCLADSLEELVIINWDIDWMNTDDADAFEPISSLIEFEKLHSIEVTAYVLLGKEEVRNKDGAPVLPWYSDEAVENFIEALPMSLKHLIIKDCSVAIFECLARLLDEGIPPKLKTVKLVFNPDSEIEVPARDGFYTGAELEKMALDRGVLLTRHECCG